MEVGIKGVLKKIKKTRNLIFVGTLITWIYALLCIVSKRRCERKDIDNDNFYFKSSYAKESTAENYTEVSIYEGKIKPALDKGLSFVALIILFPLFVVIAIAIYLDDPGSVLFVQKRVGRNGHYFMLHKFRSMKIETPHDVPTHELQQPNQYLTKVGRILRRTSLDELPQIWDIFRGKMSIIGPRPALWNQSDLIAEREKWNANSVTPGLTGLAQIKGRDEILITDKAKLDGEYVKVLRTGGVGAVLQDVRCFMQTIGKVLKCDGVVEGGTGAIKNSYIVDASDAGFEEYGYLKKFNIDKTRSVKVLITGAESYIGKSFEAYAHEYYSTLSIDTLDMRVDNWRDYDFSQYDTVLHVAGIAHVDIEHVDDTTKDQYYAVNTDLAIETARKAKNAGVKQFLFMSSMIIYGGAEYVNETVIPAPKNFYGDSKWRADKGVRELQSDEFHVAVLRLPMIYGKGSKGNYQRLAKIARKTPVFPDYENKRSMLYIVNLCEFVAKLICSGEGGIYFPQNDVYSNTSRIVKLIGDATDSPVHLTKFLSPIVRIAFHAPRTVNDLAKKAFGNSYYDKKLSIYEGLDYQKIGLNKSVRETESSQSITAQKETTYKEQKLTDLNGKRILLIALPGYRDGIFKKLKELGAETELINDKPNEGFVCKTLGRYKVKFYQNIVNNYYKEQLEPLEDRNYDFILSIRGEYTPIETLKLLRERYPKSKMILYMWDGLGKLNTKGIESKWQYYDRIYTFDRIDYESHKDKISFLPLYYYEDYLPKETKNLNYNNFTYDLSFIGTGHDDRIRIIKNVMKQCERRGMKCFSYFFLPHQLVFLKNKMLNRNFKNVSMSDVRFKMMPFEQLYEVYAGSRCIVDVENKEQHGLTMRSIEILGLRRKLITTNQDIVNYDFYNPNNILVIDRDNPVLDFEFLKKPYEELDEEIYKKYSLSNWIFEVLK